MKRKLLFLTMLLILQLHSVFVYSQVSAYTFAGSSGSFTSIVGAPGTVVITTASDDDNYGTFPIGFTFNFNGNDYTTFGLNANGFITMGYVPVTTNNCLSSGLNNNVISGFNNDLYGVASGAQISYQTTGSTGSKVLTIEWTNWGFCCNGLNEFNFQIKLFETSNKIQTVYGNCPGNTTKTLQIGLRGASNADYNNRSTTTNWAATTAGTVNSATCTYSSTVKPALGQTFEWTPPPPGPRVVGTITSVQQTGTAAPGTTGNTILRVDIPVSGALGNITLNSVTVTSKNTNDNDIATGGVNVWIGNSSGPTTLVGAGATFSAGTAVVSSIATNLITGTNYFWITYDLKSTAVVNNVLDLRILVGGMSLTASDGATSPGTQPTVALNPSGSKTVGYCIPVNTAGGCGGDQLSGFNYAGINYSTGICLSSPGYLDVATVATATQGQTNNITITNGDINDYAAVWIDFNDNNSFDDAGELVFTGGPGTSLSGTITVPLTAPVGTHRIRVRNNYGSIPASSCSTQTYGETKDFRLSVLLATNCTGSPASSTTLSTINPVCAGVNFTLSLGTVYTNLGISYQWQSSPDNVTYSNISGATSYSYTTNLTESTYYRCKISCSFSGQNTNSTPLLVTLNPFYNCYCTPASSDCSDDKITSVTFAEISKTGSGCSANGYGNFTNLTGTVAQGSTQTASVGVSSGGTEYVSLWIDYNHNSIFDSDERTYIGSGFGTTLVKDVVIPETALTGLTRMRVRLQFAFEPTDACSSFLFGETEDYLVNITSCTKINYYADADGDSYGNPLVNLFTCTPPLGYVTNNSDCNDANANIKPGANEICNSIDDDCDGFIDEGLPLNTYYLDADNDGYGNSSSSIVSCFASPPTGYSGNSTDCNDGNSLINPGATEICNSIDDDCDSQIDEGVVTASITPSGSVATCSGTNITLQANTGVGYTYQWIKDGSSISGATNQSYSTSTAGTYTVKVSSGTCNATSNSTVITVNALPAATITPSGTVKSCAPDPVTLQANTGGGLTYQWSNLSGVIAGATNSSYTTNVTSTYYVQVTDANGCSKLSNGKVFKNYAEARVKITVIGSLNICSTGSVTFTAKVKDNYTYQWFKNDGPIDGETSTTYVATTTGTYKYKATTKDGCTAFSASKTVTGCKLGGDGDLADEKGEDPISLYPNPSDGVFQLSLTLPDDYSGNLIIDVSNAMGQIISREHSTVSHGDNKQQFNFGQQLPAGIYLIRISTDDHVFTKRFIISR